SSRRLAYPEAKLGPGKFEGTQQIHFKDNAGGRWQNARAWRGSLTENVVSAVCRDLLVAAMQRLEAADYPIVLTVHDEIVCEVPDGFGSEAELVQLMTALPTWASGLPRAAKAWTRQRYAKTKAPKPAAVASETVEPIPMDAAPPVAQVLGTDAAAV